MTRRNPATISNADLRHRSGSGKEAPKIAGGIARAIKQIAELSDADVADLEERIIRVHPDASRTYFIYMVSMHVGGRT